MKKIIAIALGMAVLPSSVNAAEVIATFSNQGQCMSAWNDLNNALRKELRESGQGMSQSDLGAEGHFYCTKVGNGWALIAL